MQRRLIAQSTSTTLPDARRHALLLDDTANPAAQNFGIHAASITFAGIGLVRHCRKARAC